MKVRFDQAATPSSRKALQGVSFPSELPQNIESRSARALTEGDQRLFYSKLPTRCRHVSGDQWAVGKGRALNKTGPCPVGCRVNRDANHVFGAQHDERKLLTWGGLGVPSKLRMDHAAIIGPQKYAAAVDHSQRVPIHCIGNAEGSSRRVGDALLRLIEKGHPHAFTAAATQGAVVAENLGRIRGKVGPRGTHRPLALALLVLSHVLRTVDRHASAVASIHAFIDDLGRDSGDSCQAEQVGVVVAVHEAASSEQGA